MEYLTTEMLMKQAPSIFTEEPSDKLSPDYVMVKTYDVVKRMADIGYLPVKAFETKVRNPGMRPYAKHLLRFRQDREWAYREELPEVVLWNSHNGMSSWVAKLGIFRMVCSNGLIVQSASFGSFRIPHKGDAINGVLNAVEHIQSQANHVLEVADSWKKARMDWPDQLHFAERILKVRYPDIHKAPIEGKELLSVQREEDDTEDLWTVFNRIQENVMMGGMSSGRRGAKRLRTTRPIRGVNETIRFNQEAWKIAEDQYKKLMDNIKLGEYA